MSVNLRPATYLLLLMFVDHAVKYYQRDVIYHVVYARVDAEEKA